jgi:hypothetical protein
MENPNSNAQGSWTYSADADVPQTSVTATAVRRAGPNATETLTLDDGGAEGGNFIP